MKNRFITALAIVTLFATAAFADGPVRRTIVVKDGKVITDNILGPETELLIGKRAYLGVSLNDISPELSDYFGATKENGVLVESVADDSPAEKAGLRVGDVIVSVDGQDVHGSGDVRRSLREKKEGDSVRIEVVRGRARQTLVASVVEKAGPRLMLPADIEALTSKVGRAFDGSEWHARVEHIGSDCSELQGRIKELETRLKELEKKLQK
jgi:membrane-associated protease RseP (regulator of RpoE activity)